MTKLLSQEDIESILSRDPHFIKVHPAEEWEEVTIDRKLWKDKDYEDVLRSVNLLVGYLNRPYIEDDFGSDHEKRREWQTDYEKKYGEPMEQFFREDSLKGGIPYFAMGSPLLGLRMKYIGEDKEEFKRQIEMIYEGLPPKIDYDLELDTSQKIAVIKSLKVRIHRFLKYLSSESRADNLN